jgi:two-component system, sensor histidine kinase and response regulator
MTDKVNILLVDDRRENLVALEAILEKLEQNLIKVTSGSEALKFLLKNDAAVILLDVDMPHMDGFQTAELIRQRDKTRHTPIIFLTAINKSDVHVSQGYALGGVDYIFKPFVPEVLRSKVSAFVEVFRQRQEIQRQSSLIKAERDLADAILDTVAGFVLVLDAEGRILRVNRAFEEMTGYAFDDVRGRFLYQYLEESDAAEHFLKAGRGPADCREYWLTNGNNRLLVSWCATALSKDLAGNGHFVVTGRDMTELRRRTEELEAFTYSVSHDMRAPVRAIDGFTRILIEEYTNSVDDEGRRLLEIVRQNTEKMGQLIDGLLALSRLGRERLMFTDIDMNDVAKDAFEEQEAAGARGRLIEFKLEELPMAYGDKRLIMQVFQNLLANAIKFTRNQPAASIEVGSLTGAGEDVYFVRDNGVGFDMNHAQKLFGTFQRLHAANEFEGSGIGLATVQRIIDRHGGRVWAEAETNKGATFYFSLPVREQRKAG